MAKNLVSIIGLDELEVTNNALFIRKTVTNMNVNSVLIVDETHSALLLKDGIALDNLTAGRYEIFDKKRGWFKDEKIGAFRVDLIYFSKTAKLRVFWGTRNLIDLRDAETGVPVKIGASGEFEVRIENPRKFYMELVGADKNFTLDTLKERLQGRLINEIEPAIATAMREGRISYNVISEHKHTIAEFTLPKLRRFFSEDYGLEMVSFIISRIVMDEQYKQEIEKEFSKEKRLADDREKELRRRETTEYWVEQYERLKDRQVDREILLKKLERQDYDKYLEVCCTIGWEPKTRAADTGRFCTKCGHRFEADTKFCPGCGERVGSEEIECTRCKKSNTAGSIFCSTCGTKLL